MQPGSITGNVLADTDGNGSGDAPIPGGVTLTLLDSAGNPVDGDPVTAGVQAITTTTNASGAYSFTGLIPGTYGVAETQPGGYLSLSDKDGGNLNQIAPITVTAGAANTANNFVEVQPGSITGNVVADTDGNGTGDAPIPGGVTLTLLDSAGNPVDGDPVTAGVQAITTTTNAGGSYTFSNLLPGTYGVSESQPSGYLSLSDKDGGNLNQISPITVTAGAANTANDFVEVQPGSITGNVLADTDGNGSGDAPIPGGVTLTLLDSAGNPVDGDPVTAGVQAITTTTDGSGNYSFTGLIPGTYGVAETQPGGYLSVSDKDGGNLNQISPITVTAGATNTANNFVEVQPGSITGNVLADTDGNGSGDAPIPGGVTLTLLDSAGNPVDSDPVTAGVQAITTTTNASGAYSFTGLIPGTYGVAETQPGGYLSVSDKDGGNLNQISPITVTAGATNTANNFVEVQPGSITGTVLAGGNPIGGVTLTLLDSSGNPVDGDPNTPGIQLVTTMTNSLGVYTFSGVVPGSYRVVETQPAYYNNVSDKDGGNLNTIGDVTPIVVTAGQANAGNNFVEAVDMCASTWAHWQFLHPSETATGNPDGDASTNLAEFAFAQPFNSGAGDPWIIRPSATTPGTLEGVFTRPTNAIQNVTYTLEFANALTNPVTWTSITISAANTTVVANGDCTETVTISDLETLTGLTAGTGVVRIRADLDENNDSVIDSTTHTEVEGWKETTFGMCCSTYSFPYLREAVFTGTIDGVTGQALDLTTAAGSTDLSTLITPGAAYYVEVTSGIGEGFRYDVSSATATTLVLANDSNLFANSGPYNNVLGAPPSVLAGSSIVLRRHWTLAEQFPPSGLTASNDKATSDQVQLFVDGQWVIYWLYSDGVSAPRWVLTGDNTLADRATTILAPGQGLFFYNRQPSTTLLAYGEIRNNNFIRPLQAGSNLVSGGYPMDQSAAAAGGRAMSVPDGFSGSRDPAIADSFFLWNGDTTLNATGYDTYFLNNNAPRLPSSIKWVKVGDASLASQDAATLLLGNRSAFLRSKNGLAGYTDPQPWAP